MTVRFISCDKSAYITNKIIKSTKTTDSRSTSANTGLAGTIDLFKLNNETVVSGGLSGIELTRGLLHFDLSPLKELTGSTLDLRSSNFKCFLSMSDVYGGQTTPSLFTLMVCPLAKGFSEGVGQDVVAFRDLDAVNWTTASVAGGVVTTWTSGGCNLSGTLGTSGLDYFVSGVISGSVTSSLFYTQEFVKGDEGLYLDITPVVSATLVGIIPDNGFRLSFIPTQEEDQYTRFVKRFASRHVQTAVNRPKIVASFNDSFIDNQAETWLDMANTVAVYNTVTGRKRNLLSGSTEITGSNSLILQLVASKSITTWTSSYSASHSRSINHLTTSFRYFSASFTGSQQSFNNNIFVSGVYQASVYISSSDSSLVSLMGTDTKVSFQPLWKSLSLGVLLASGSVFEMKKQLPARINVFEQNYVVTVPNLKQEYSAVSKSTRLRVSVHSNDTDLESSKLITNTKPLVFNSMHWRMIDRQTKRLVNDFDLDRDSTRLSSDGDGMFFELFVGDLSVNRVYELEFLIKEENQSYHITGLGFLFKVIA